MRQAAGMVSRLEAAVAQSPTDRSLKLNLASATKMAERAEAELSEVALRDQVDIVNYRLVRRTSSDFIVRGVSRSLELFQETVTLIYDALTGRPKARARVRSESHSESQMLFGWSYEGSLGIVLLAPSEKGLFRTRFDDVATAITQVFDIGNSYELKDAAARVGTAAVRKLYEWAETNASEGYDLDLRWRNAAAIEYGRYVDTSQFGRLAKLISETSEVEERRSVLTGALVGFDSVHRSFHFVVPGGDAYKGHLAKDFPQRREHTVNRSYEATIVSSTTTRFSTGEEAVRHYLTELKPVEAPPSQL
jgi:hypothetical protein